MGNRQKETVDVTCNSSNSSNCSNEGVCSKTLATETWNAKMRTLTTTTSDVGDWFRSVSAAKIRGWGRDGGGKNGARRRGDPDSSKKT